MIAEEAEKENFMNTKIPAITKVAECKSEETGVGPSIASGNHRKVNDKIDLKDSEKKSTKSHVAENSKSAKKPLHASTTKIIKPKSPNLLNKIAEEEPCTAEERESQWPIRRKLMNPKISQESKNPKCESENVTRTTVKKKPISLSEKSIKWGSNSKY